MWIVQSVTNTDMFEEALLTLCSYPTEDVYVSTFMIPSIRSIARIPIRPGYGLHILVGLQNGIKRKEARGYDELMKLYTGGLECRFANTHHAKLYIGTRPQDDLVLLGSKNIGQSRWREIGVLIRDKERIWRKTFFSWWNLAYTSAERCRKAQI